MWIENECYHKELEGLIESYKELFDKLNEKTLFITGGTGLIGKNIINSIMLFNKEYNKNVKIVSLVRNIDKAKVLFSKVLEACGGNLSFVQGDVEDCIRYEGNVDYIIHGASNTSSKKFVEEPVEVIDTSLNGCRNILSFAKDKNISSMIFLSTMEIYGNPGKGNRVNEEFVGKLSSLNIRNCYPISKAMCENLCGSFYSEYNIPVKIARLTQTMGPGVNYNDGRVFAAFARCVIEGNDIVLNTKGETERSYLYVLDAVSALLAILFRGENGSAYNIANEDSYCSILDMAKSVATIGNVNVRFDIKDVSSAGYADTLYMDLDTSKLKNLGWNATTNLSDMYKKMIYYMKSENME